MVEADHPEISVAQQAVLLSINRSSLYYKPKSESEFEVSDKQLVNKVFEKYPFFGYRKLSAYIQKHHGQIINCKRVLKYMKELGIKAICPGPNMSRRNFKEAVKPYLLKDIQAAHANHVWGIDESAPESQKMAKICLKTIEKSLPKFKKSTIWNGLININIALP